MADERHPLISVSLVTYQPGIWLQPCLESVLRQTHPSVELIVTDNGADPDTERRVRELTRGRANVRFRRSDRNLGFARAHNQAIDASTAEYVCLLNQDMVLDPDYLRVALTGFDEADVGSVQGRLRWLGPNLELTSRIDSTGLVMHRSRRVVSRGQGTMDGSGNDQPGDVFGVDGACPIYRRAALDDVRMPLGAGGEYLDEDFFMYKEDIDLAWRLLLRGWKARYVPTAIGWHARGAGESAAHSPWQVLRQRRTIPSWVKRLSWRNQRLMQIKNEDAQMALRDAGWLAAREIMAFSYLVLSNPRNVVAAIDLARLMPSALRKRRHIQHHRVLDRASLARWFV